MHKAFHAGPLGRSKQVLGSANVNVPEYAPRNILGPVSGSNMNHPIHTVNDTIQRHTIRQISEHILS